MRVGEFYYSFLISIVPLVVPFSIMGVSLGKNPEPTTNDFIVILFVGLLIWITNMLLVESFSMPRYLSLFATNLFFFFLLLGIGTLIPSRMINIYKFGNLENASLILDETGCSIVQHHGLITTADLITRSTSNPKTCSLSKVMIRSRLGNTYYLETSRSSGTSVVQFTIPGQNVLTCDHNRGIYEHTKFSVYCRDNFAEQEYGAQALNTPLLNKTAGSGHRESQGTD
jgi:hypothetical protein